MYDKELNLMTSLSMAIAFLIHKDASGWGQENMSGPECKWSVILQINKLLIFIIIIFSLFLCAPLYTYKMIIYMKYEPNTK